MKLNGAQIVIETLIEQGTTTVFGYPGGQVINIYDALKIAFSILSQHMNKVLLMQQTVMQEQPAKSALSSPLLVRVQPI